MGLIEPILLTGGRLASHGEDAPCIEDRGGINEISQNTCVVCALCMEWPVSRWALVLFVVALVVSVLSLSLPASASVVLVV